MTPSRISILAALAGNIAVALVKLGAFLFSASSAMLVEAIHSAIDTVNQVMLLVGLRRASRKADDSHPFGYGLDAYFWTFLVGLLIFAVGGVASIAEGIHKLRHPEPVEHVTITVVVLGLSAVFEWLSLLASMRAIEKGRPKLFRRRFPKVTLAQAIHFSPDPGVFEVLAEGIASILGLGLAFLGVVGSAWFGWMQADGIAAIAIGTLLVLLSIVILAETHSLMTGEAASAPIIDGLREILTAETAVLAIRQVDTMFIGPDMLLVAAIISFQPGLETNDIERITDSLCARMHEAEPRIRQLYIRPSVPAGPERLTFTARA
jgi:cation diffusion facilitator family transporter